MYVFEIGLMVIGGSGVITALALSLSNILFNRSPKFYSGKVTLGTEDDGALLDG